MKKYRSFGAAALICTAIFLCAATGNQYFGTFTGHDVTLTTTIANGGLVLLTDGNPSGKNPIDFSASAGVHTSLDVFGNFTLNGASSFRVLGTGNYIGNGSGLTNTIPFTLSAATNFVLTFNGTPQQITFTNAVGVTFGSVTGTSGSWSCYLSNNIPIAYPANVVWLTAHPTTVVKGVVSFTQYGLITVGGYVESQ